MTSVFVKSGRMYEYIEVRYIGTFLGVVCMYRFV